VNVGRVADGRGFRGVAGPGLPQSFSCGNQIAPDEHRETDITTDPVRFPGVLAPITRIGGGEVRVDRALRSKTAAWDADDLTGSLSFGYQALSGKPRPKTCCGPELFQFAAHLLNLRQNPLRR